MIAKGAAELKDAWYKALVAQTKAAGHIFDGNRPVPRSDLAQSEQFVFDIENKVLHASMRGLKDAADAAIA
jgi:hypothetical protein